jgi:hypothetical protein
MNFRGKIISPRRHGGHGEEIGRSGFTTVTPVSEVRRRPGFFESGTRVFGVPQTPVSAASIFHLFFFSVPSVPPW